MKKTDLVKTRRQVYQHLKKHIEKYENYSGKRLFQTDHQIAMDFLLGDEGTWHASEVEKQAASILETLLHIESWQEIKSEEAEEAVDIEEEKLMTESDSLLKILDSELKEKISILDELIKSSFASRAGKARAERDPAYIALREIEVLYAARKHLFKLRGRSTEFAVEMHAKFPEIKNLESIKKLVTKLNKTNDLIPRK
jgi:hypothetical protein